jgi:GNAT superfamily N-acetyltransferase
METADTPDRSAPWWRPRPSVDIPEGTLAEVDPGHLVTLRRAVLRDDRGDLPASYPFDAEPSSLHLGVTAPDGSAVGGVTVIVDPLAGSAPLRLVLMAVDPAVQGRGVGRHLVLAVQERAAGAGLAVWAAARVSALDFYVGLGFRPRGDVFVGPMDLPHRHVLWRPR